MSDSQREALRQKALSEIALLDTPPEREFDALAKLTQRMLGTPMSSITLVAPERQWFKARCGPLAPETTRTHAFCPVAVEKHPHVPRRSPGRSRGRSRDGASGCEADHVAVLVLIRRRTSRQERLAVGLQKGVDAARVEMAARLFA